MERFGFNARHAKATTPVIPRGLGLGGVVALTEMQAGAVRVEVEA